MYYVVVFEHYDVVVFGYPQELSVGVPYWLSCVFPPKTCFKTVDLIAFLSIKKNLMIF